MAAHRHSLKARILRDERGSARRKISLTAGVANFSDQSWAIIHDLSETGLKLTSDTTFEKDETIIVELPLIGATEARIVWSDRNSFGAEFVEPVSKGTVSAALLQSHPFRAGAINEATIKEFVIGTDPSLEEIADWAYEFEVSEGASGYKLLGFRKGDNGVINAVCSKESPKPH